MDAVSQVGPPGMSVAPCRPKKNEFAWQIIGSQVVFLRLRLHRLGPHLGCSVFCFFDVQVKTKNSFENAFIYIYMGVSIKNGTPKSASLMGFSIINHPF